MKGMDSFETTREMTLDELAQFMDEHWDRDQYNDFKVGHPTAANAKDQYIILPASENWCVIIYPKTGGLRKKKYEIKLACTYTTPGATKLLEREHSVFRKKTVDVKRAKNAVNLNKEMQTVADEALRIYSDYLKQLMREAGFISV